MRFKLEFTFDISDSSLLIDANDGRDEEYTSLEDVPEDTLMDVVYHYLDGVVEGMTGCARMQNKTLEILQKKLQNLQMIYYLMKIN